MSKTETISPETLLAEFKSILEPKPRRGVRGSDYVDNLDKAKKGEIVKIEGLHYSMKNRYVRMAKKSYPDVVVLFESTGEDPSLKITDNRIYRVVLVNKQILDKIKG